MALVVADIGNSSSIKLGVAQSADSRPWHWRGRIALDALSSLAQHLPPPPAKWFLASVNRLAAGRLRQWLDHARPDDSVQQVDRHWIDVRLAVDLPDQVGIDRLLAASAARALAGAHHGVVVVDAGTAITVDATTSLGEFLGGAIFAGPALALAALAERTDRLPHLDATPLRAPHALLGKTTEQAMLVGVWQGAAGAIEHLVRRVGQALGGPYHVYLTGGDMPELAAMLSRDWQFHDDLVLRGLLQAARQNAS